MASYNPPTYTDLTIFNPIYWETSSSSSYLTYSQAQEYFVSLAGNETIAGMMYFTGGISTNYISPIAINDNLVIDDYSNIYLTTNTSNVCIYSSGNILNVANPINATEYYINGSLIFPTIDSNVSGYVLSNDGTSTEWIEQNSNISIGGSNTQIQFNNNGNLDASANLTWNGSNLDVVGNVMAFNYYLGSNLLIPTIDSNVSGYVLSNDGSKTEWIENTTIPTISSSTSGQYLYNNGNTISWANVSSSSSSNIGSSSNTQILYNNSGSVSGSSSLTYNNSSGLISLGGISITSNSFVVNNLSNFYFGSGAGITNNGYIWTQNGSLTKGSTKNIIIYNYANNPTLTPPIIAGYVSVIFYNTSGNWSYANGIIYPNQVPNLTVAGTTPSISSGYSTYPYISLYNNSNYTCNYGVWVNSSQ